MELSTYTGDALKLMGFFNVSSVVTLDQYSEGRYAIGIKMGIEKRAGSQSA